MVEVSKLHQCTHSTARAKGEKCGAVQRPRDCEQGHSVQLQIMAETDPPSTPWVLAFEDWFQVLLDKCNAEHAQSPLKFESDDDDIFQAYLSLGPIVITYNQNTNVVKEIIIEN